MRLGEVPDEAVFAPEEALATLARYEVEFIVIGGYATVLHGSSHFTTDADVTPRADPDNLRRLADALREMNARIRSVSEPDGLEFTCDEHFLKRMATVNLITRFGAFDLSFHPSAFPDGYEDLLPNAVEVSILGERVRVAGLGDIIRSKEAADRPKDRGALPHLYALQDELAKRDRS